MAMENPGDTGLVYWYSCEESTGNLVDELGAHDLTETNGPIASISGKVGNARDLEASSTQYFTKSSHVDLQISGDQTWFGWLKLESIPGTMCVFSKWQDSGADYEYLIQINGSGQIYLNVRNGGLVYWSSTLTTATWYFFMAWIDVSENKDYIQINNGTPVSAASSTYRADSAPFCIGGRTDASQHLDGVIDEFGGAKRVYTADQRSWFYNNGSGRTYNDFFEADQATAGVGMSPSGMIYMGLLEKYEKIFGRKYKKKKGLIQPDLLPEVIPI